MARTETTPAPLPAISGTDQDALTHAYKTGVISGWRLATEGRYRLTLTDKREEYIDPAKLTTYLQHLRKAAS